MPKINCPVLHATYLFPSSVAWNLRNSGFRPIFLTFPSWKLLSPAPPARRSSWLLPRAFALKSISRLGGPFSARLSKSPFSLINLWLVGHSASSNASFSSPWHALSSSVAFSSWAWISLVLCPFYLGYRLQVLFFKKINIII